MKKRTIARYGKYRVTLEQGFIDRREWIIVLTITGILGLILLGKYIGIDTISLWWNWK